VGGLSGYIALQAIGDAGGPLPSVLPPSDWNLATDIFFPAQAIVVWATVAGLSWLACNFGMAQRLLAAKSEADAQKGLLGLGVLATLACLATYMIGSSMRFLAPDILPDQAFMKVMLEMFPTGARGLLVAGMMAALLSSADGMLTAASALLSEDIYLRFFRPAASDAQIVRVHRIFEGGTLLLAVALISVLVEAKSAVTFVQTFYGDVLGVVVALYIVGMFSTRATPRAAFAAMFSGLVLAVVMDIWTDWNFAYIGFASFLYALVATLAFSRFEKAPALAQLENLTIHTLPDAKGPWVGLQAWPGLWKWALLLSTSWFGLCLAWEWLVRSG
jgi:SSS family solute:Na+ symporter